MSFRSFLILIILVIQTGCAGLYTGRTYLTEFENEDSSFFNPREDFPVVAGDSDRTRSPASYGEEDRASRALKEELRDLERSQSDESLELYNSYKHRLGTTSQKIYFLKLPDYEKRDYLMARGIYSDSRTVEALTPSERFGTRRMNDVYLGMNKHDVLESLGKPLRVEVAGNPRNENERWLYRMNGGTKYIYFESGRVEGWE